MFKCLRTLERILIRCSGDAYSLPTKKIGGLGGQMTQVLEDYYETKGKPDLNKT